MIDFKYIGAKALKRLLNPPALNMCKIDRTSVICSRSELTKVNIGKYTYIGNNCFIVRTNIGNYCSIADRVCIGGAEHPITRVSTSPVFHDGNNVLHKHFAQFPRIETPITTIENDVWIGIGTLIKAGVTIHNGAVIGMGSVVTHDVPAYEIWAGNPAHKIRKRFDSETIDELLKSEWWNKSDKEIMELAKRFDDPKKIAGENGL